MENENKKTCEIIIKKDGETVVQEKTNAIFCIINKDDRVTNGVFIDNVSGKDLLCMLISTQEIIDKQLEKHKELELFWAIRRYNKLKDKVSKNEE